MTDETGGVLAGIRVDFTVSGPNATAGFASTDVSGVADFCYTGDAAGADSITAAVGALTDMATRTWARTQKPPPVNDPPVAEVPRSTDLVLGCSDRRVVLEDVFIEGKKVRLLGVAAREFAGRKVQLVFGATGKTVAEVTVGANGHFTATAPLPEKKLRNSNKARYVARVGSEASLRSSSRGGCS